MAPFNLPPQALQMLMAQLARVGPGSAGGPQGPASGANTGVMGPSGQIPQPQAGSPQTGAMAPPQAPLSEAPLPQLGGSNTTLAGGTAIPQVRGVPMSAQPGYQQKPIAGHGIAMIPAAAFAIKQKMHSDKVQKARAAANDWIAQQQNPEVQKAMQEAAKKDPAIAKALEKKQKEFVKLSDEAMKDPNSAAAQGIQLAYKDQQVQEAQQVQLQEAYQKMRDQQAQAQQRQAQAQQEQAKAAQITKQTELAGTVTERDKFQAQQKMQLQSNALKAKLQQSQMTTVAMLKATHDRIEGAERMTKERVAGELGAAKIRAGATLGAAKIRAQATSTAIIQEYKAIDTQVAELDKRQKALQDHIDKNTHLGGLWEPDDLQQVQSEIQEIEGQKQILGSQLQMLQMKDQFFQSKGIIPAVTPAAPPTGGGQQPVIHKF